MESYDLHHDYDIYSYRNNNPNMTESVSEISEMIVQGNTEPITDWLNEVISEGALPDEMQRAKVLLEKLAGKKAQVVGSGQEHEVQENTKKSNREMKR